MYRRWIQTVAALAVAGGAFTYGILVGRYEAFPYDYLREAYHAAQALRTVYSGDRAFLYDGRYPIAASVDVNLQQASPGVTMMTLFRGGLFGAVVIDLEGNVLHEWRLPFSKVWPQAPHLQFQNRDHMIAWHGFHLYPNGDLVFSFDMSNFPPGSGLVRIDKDSNVVWSVAENTHHDVDVDEDGTIYTLGQTFLQEEIQGLDFPTPLFEDHVLIVSDTGEIKDRISIDRAILDSSFKGLFLNYGEGIRAPDPLHSNSVQVLPRAYDAAFPQFNPGDLLVSLRHVNAIVVIDRTSKLVKWAMIGRTIGQHDADFLPSGNLMVFDNYGFETPSGQSRSRVVEIDPVRRMLVWSFTTPDGRMFSKRAGNQQELPNGNVLVTVSEQGRVFEVTREGTLVWQYVNRMPLNGESGSAPLVGMIADAQRLPLDTLKFLDTSTP